MMEARVGIEAKIVLVLLSLLGLAVRRFNKIRTLSRCKHKFSTIFLIGIFLRLLIAGSVCSRGSGNPDGCTGG